MINLDLGGNGDTHTITNEVIHDAIEMLDNATQQVRKKITTIDRSNNVRFSLGSCFEMFGNGSGKTSNSSSITLSSCSLRNSIIEIIIRSFTGRWYS